MATTRNLDEKRESFYAMINGRQIYIERDGTGPNMIMTHGLGASSNVFQPLKEIFSTRFTVIRFDWPGLGMSPLCKELPPLTIPAYVSVLEGVMDYLKIESAVLVGHSLGGIISMHLAARYPERVVGLAAIGAGRTRFPPSKSRTHTLKNAEIARKSGVWSMVDDRVQGNILAKSPALARALLRQVTASTDPEGYAQACDALTDQSHVDPDYTKISCPTVIVGGTHDMIAPMDVTKELFSLIRSGPAKVHMVTLETGHMQIIEDVDGTAAAIEVILS